MATNELAQRGLQRRSSSRSMTMTFHSEENDMNLGGLLLVAWIFLSWLTHVIVCIASSKWVFLLAGAIFFPIGCVHGTGVWLGFF